MEANLNQFRFFTVSGEQQANTDRSRRSGRNSISGRGADQRAAERGLPDDNNPDLHPGLSTMDDVVKNTQNATGSSSQPLEVVLDDEGKDQPVRTVSCTLGSFPSDAQDRTSDRSTSHKGSSGSINSIGESIRNEGAPGPLKGGVPPTASPERSDANSVSSHAAATKHEDDEDLESVRRSEVEQDASGEELSAEKSLIQAIRALERSINNQNHLLNKKLKRDRTMKSPTDRAPEPVIHKSATIRTDKVQVYLRVVFLKIGEIDTMKENFMADAFIQARWREPAYDGQAAQSIDDIDWDKIWNPKLYVENNLGEPKETVWQTLMFSAKGEATVCERRRIKGCFLENLELDEFPFDTQDLTLTISTERSETELELLEDSSEISSINVQSFVDEQEWKLHSHVETHRRVTTKIYQNSKFKHPAFSTSCRASRRPGFFIWNIFLVMGKSFFLSLYCRLRTKILRPSFNESLFICSLTFATFSVDLNKPENRLQLSFILLLTTITFKFVVSQTLPRISYLTYLDKYILTSMAILCGVCVWHAIIPLFKKDEELAKKIDMWALILSASSYFLFHVFFFMYIYFVAMKKRWTYDQKDREHRERVKKLQRLHEIASCTTNTEPMSYNAPPECV